jgi:hypothetical protein
MATIRDIVRSVVRSVVNQVTNRIGFDWISYWTTRSAYFSGEFDFLNNKWLDRTTNSNHANIVETGCLLVISDITITLSIARAGVTVTKVNESVLTTGVTLNGAGTIISIDQSALVVIDSKLWSIELSNSELFVLQTMASPYIFANGNIGTISGVEDIAWSWSTSDSAYAYHLKNGFSIYPYADVSKIAALYVDHTPFIKVNDMWAIDWEGYFLDAVDLQYIFSTPVKITTNYLYCQYTKSTKRIYFYAREAISNFYYDLTISTNKIKIKVAYSGCGYANNASWKLYIDGEEVTPTFVAPSGINDRANYCDWAGNGRGASKLAVRNYTFNYNGVDWKLILDGVVDIGRIYEKPTKYIYIPVFTTVDALGYAITNPSYVDEWNYPESKIKMPVNNLLFNNDINGILYTDVLTPNVLNLEEFYPNFGGKIHCNNGTEKRLRDLIVTKTVADLSEYLNGFRTPVLPVAFRTDTEGSNDLRSILFDDLVQEENILGSAHVFSLTNGDKWGALIASGDISIAIHDLIPTFYKYANYLEGKLAYDLADIADQAAGTVIENQGKIGYAYGAYSTPIDQFAGYVANFGFTYPPGVTPDADDDNSDWWQWWIDQWEIFLIGMGSKISACSDLGALPSGIHEYHPDFMRILEEAIYDDISGVNLTDDLVDSVSIFGAQINASIVADSGVNCQKLTGTATPAYGNLNIGNLDWYGDNVLDISFDVKSDGALPITSINTYNANNTHNITFAANITFNGVVYANPCSINTWYKIRIINKDDYQWLIIYNAANECILFSQMEQIYRNGRIKKLVFYITGSDCLIKNVSIRTCQRNRGNFEFKNNVKYDGVTGVNTAAQWIILKEKELVRHLMAASTVFVFSHYIRDPLVKSADGTFDGVMDLSYLKLKELIQLVKLYGGEFVNSNSMRSDNILLDGKRRNRFPNGDFETNKFGFTGEVWGFSGVAVAAGEAANSIDGTNIVLLTSIATISFPIRHAGIKRLKFWAKGNIIAGIMQDGKPSTYYYANFTSAGYVFYNLPIVVDYDYQIIGIAFTPIGTTYLHKICFDDR